MKEVLKKSLNQAIKSLEKEHNVNLSKTKIEIKENKEKQFGDFSSNLALVLSKEFSKPPKDIAEMLLKELGEKDFIDRMEVAGPGFINFFLSHASRTEILKTINKEKNKFGFSTKKKAEKDSVLIEYVSSNPTGPLHVGHGRGAAFGSVLASILKATGHQVDEEYYVNDQGRQTEIRSLSVWLRYLEIFNQVSLFPNNCYQGAYIESLAKELEKEIGNNPKYAKDIDLLLSQTKRCSDILRNLSQDQLKEDNFLSNIFTDKEVEYCNRYSDRIIHLSGKYAAKEAVKKALDQLDIKSKVRQALYSKKQSLDADLNKILEM